MTVEDVMNKIRDLTEIKDGLMRVKTAREMMNGEAVIMLDAVHAIEEYIHELGSKEIK